MLHDIVVQTDLIQQPGTTGPRKTGSDPLRGTIFTRFLRHNRRHNTQRGTYYTEFDVSTNTNCPGIVAACIADHYINIPDPSSMLFKKIILIVFFSIFLRGMYAVVY